MKNSASSFNRLKLTVVAVTAVIAFAGFYGGFFGGSRAKANSSGPPNSHTNAPAFANLPAESNCTACHSGQPLNDPSGSIRITGLPANYRPGQAIPVTVRVSQSNAVSFGFQTTPLNNAGATLGTFTLPTQMPMQQQIINGQVGTPPNQITRRYVEHTGPGTVSNEFNTKAWTFTWTAPAQRRGRVTFYAAGNGANGDGGMGGDYIFTTSAAVCSGAVQGNFDTDAKADIALFRPTDGIWYRLNSVDNSFQAVQFGAQGDKIVPGDFDGDGKNDVAVFRAGIWYVLRSSDGGFNSYQFGVAGDIPVVGDFTGDGRSELAVFRPSSGTWFTSDLTNGAFVSFQFGTSGDKPVQGDFDADGKSDFAVYRPSNNVWYIARSSNGAVDSIFFGAAGDRPTPGDFDGDGRTDIGVFRPSNGTWFVQKSSAGFTSTQFGANGDVPAPTDYDGDCVTDIAVYRGGNWFILNSADNSVRSVGFGSPGDVPVAAGYTPE